MTDQIALLVSHKLGIPLNQVAHTISLLNDGATIPFISRYRKEATGGLDDVSVQSIDSQLAYYKKLQDRKSTIIKTIEDQGKLTPELSKRIIDCWESTTLEDIYLPFKPKRHTRAEAARQKGLEPLAKIIMAQHNDDITTLAKRFVKSDIVPDEQAAINGAKDIIAEWVAENARVRNKVRSEFRHSAVLTSSFVPGKEIEGRNYENYYEFSQPLRHVRSHQLLAIRRGEKEGFLKVSISIDGKRITDSISRMVLRGNSPSTQAIIQEAVADSYSRLIKPTIETEFANASKGVADDQAIDLFAQNLKQLLFAPPLGQKNIMAIDPGFRTGCKVVCLDQQGNLLCHDVIYPTAPHYDIDGATATVTSLAKKYGIDAIALGNGTASREAKNFLQRIKFDKKISINVVSENGASIYSASDVAREEFPNEDVTVRGAVSIGRRLLDPLAELVKIDPKSIGVGQYQHDVDQGKLKDALHFTVESCVNSVGVNVNTASKQLLTYVAGLGPVLAQNIVTYRAEHGKFSSRNDILKVPKLGKKTFTQAAGFLRVPESDNPLDNSAVHPERYELVKQMASDCNCTVTELIKDSSKREQINIEKYEQEGIGRPTLIDIVHELDKPGRDPRTSVQEVEFDDKIHDISDLRIGMELNGIVTNITAFGAFVDIGVHKEGLVHVSEMSDKRITNPSKYLHINQHVIVKVTNVDVDRKRIALSMKGLQQPQQS